MTSQSLLPWTSK